MHHWVRSQNPMKTPALLSLGVFLCLLSLPLAASCPADGALHKARVAKVVDGDSLRLADGRSVRVLGINTPELARDGRSAEPLARRARNELEKWLSKDRVVWLQYGPQRKDRHGRTLAWVFHGDHRQHLAAHFLAKGLGFQVVVAPNESYAKCLHDVEKHSINKRLGVWSKAYYRPLNTAALNADQAGFRRITGRVSKVDRSRSGWWVELDDRVVIRIDHKLAGRFASAPEHWFGKKLQLRGWLVWRGEQRRGYKPWLMALTHPLMLEHIGD